MCDVQFDSADPEIPERSGSVPGKLIRLVFCLLASTLPVIFGSLSLRQPQFEWIDSLVAAGLAASTMAIFAVQEKLPWRLGAISGLISGSGSYLAAAILILQIQLDSGDFIILSAVLGSLPGIFLFYILTWIYYVQFHSDDSESVNDSPN